MSETKIYVVARLRALPDRGEAVKAILTELLGPTRQEIGCIRYDLGQNQADPAEFTFMEEWASQEALDRHLATPHIQAALVRLQPLLVESPAISLYHPVTA